MWSAPTWFVVFVVVCLLAILLIVANVITVNN